MEVFVTVGKSGSDSAAMAEALGRLISGWLRSSANPNKSLEEIASQLRGIGGSSSIGFGSNRIGSIPDAVAKVLFDELSLSDRLEHSDFNLLESGLASTQQELFVEGESSDDDMAKVEEKLNKNEVVKNASMCPECGNMSLINAEGCQKCTGCGYSRC